MISQNKYKIAKLSGIPALFNFINRKRPLVLAYHGIYDGPKRPGQIPETFVHIDDLRAQLLAIKRRYHIIHPEDFQTAVSSGNMLKPNSALITFDDGYESFHRLAFPVLSTLEICPIVFVATQNVENHEPFWFDMVWLFFREGNAEERDWLAGMTSIETIGGKKADLVTLILKKMKRMLPQERNKIAVEIRQALSRKLAESDVPLDLFFAMNPDQLAEMAKEGVVFGGHTHTHTILSLMPPEMVQQEIRTNRMKLRSMVGQDIHFFAYPNGGREDFSDFHKLVLKEGGYGCAFSLTQQRSSIAFDPMDISRFNVAPEDFIESLLIRCTGMVHAYNLWIGRN